MPVSWDKMVIRLATVIGVAMALYHFFSVRFPFFSSIQHQNVHLGFSLLLTFLPLVLKTKGRGGRLVLVFLTVLTVVTTGYIWIYFDDLVDRAGAPTAMDTLMGVLLIGIVLEATRRTYGWAIPIVSIACILYAYLGPYLPVLDHGGFRWERIVASLSTSLSGIYSAPLDISATTIVIFIIFMGFYDVMEGSSFFTELSMGAAKYSRSGPGQVSVISSALVGMINGSAAANVAVDGVVTIPMMIKRGFSREFAGAVEAAASSGGQIMPPVMGAGAFVMATILGISYAAVCKAAIIPALLYFFGVGWAIHANAIKLGHEIVRDGDVPSISRTFRRKGYLFLPVLVMIYLLVSLVSPPLTAFWGILFILVIAAVQGSFRPGQFVSFWQRDLWRKLGHGLLEAAKIGASIGVVCACLGIIIQIIVMTGLSHTISKFIVEAAGGNLLYTLLLAMLTTLLFGCGVPTVAAYLLVATLVAPALSELGIPPLAGHLFVFYFAVIASLTPPVAIAALVASGISGGNFFKTGLISVRLALPGFLIPYLFVYQPELLFQGPWPLIIARGLAVALLLVALTSAFENYLYVKNTLTERILLAMCAAGLFPSHLALNSRAALGIVVMYLLQMKRKTILAKEVLPSAGAKGF